MNSSEADEFRRQSPPRSINTALQNTAARDAPEQLWVQSLLTHVRGKYIFIVISGEKKKAKQSKTKQSKQWFLLWDKHPQGDVVPSPGHAPCACAEAQPSPPLRFPLLGSESSPPQPSPTFSPFYTRLGPHRAASLPGLTLRLLQGLQGWEAERWCRDPPRGASVSHVLALPPAADSGRPASFLRPREANAGLTDRKPLTETCKEELLLLSAFSVRREKLEREEEVRADRQARLAG